MSVTVVGVWFGDTMPSGLQLVIGQLWVDTSGGKPVLKICVSLNPVTWHTFAAK